jgi:hypothetical protein
MYAAGMPPLGAIPRGWPVGTWAWLSSGESTGPSSTPFALSLEGSGAFKQACDALIHSAMASGRDLRTWMRFLPSGFVTSGCSFGVVNVYTRPVSETTSSKTWVPVRTDSS